MSEVKKVDVLDKVETDDIPGCPACGNDGRAGKVICDICTPVTNATGKCRELDTVGSVRQETIDGIALGQIGIIHPVGYDQQIIELVTRSQAEAIIAAKDEEISSLESLRPHWAQGYSSDSLAAQTATSAISQLWGILNASNQTEAVLFAKGLETKIAAAEKFIQLCIDGFFVTDDELRRDALNTLRDIK